VTTAKLRILELLARLSKWIWVGAAIAAVYFLYRATANEAPLYYLLWSLVAGLISKYLAAAFDSRKKQLDYVDQLMERGYTQAEAMSAWEIANNGGSNLLLNLQQSDTISESDLKNN
jgi:hypothetical protein